MRMLIPSSKKALAIAAIDETLPKLQAIQEKAHREYREVQRKTQAVIELRGKLLRDEEVDLIEFLKSIKEE
jgi:hypothetical protein